MTGRIWPQLAYAAPTRARVYCMHPIAGLRGVEFEHQLHHAHLLWPRWLSMCRSYCPKQQRRQPPPPPPCSEGASQRSGDAKTEQPIGREGRSSTDWRNCESTRKNHSGHKPVDHTAATWQLLYPSTSAAPPPYPPARCLGTIPSSRNRRATAMSQRRCVTSCTALIGSLSLGHERCPSVCVYVCVSVNLFTYLRRPSRGHAAHESPFGCGRAEVGVRIANHVTKQRDGGRPVGRTR